MNLQDQLNQLDLSSHSCFYCDVRLEEMHQNTLKFNNGEFEDFTEDPSIGAFIRVYNNGNWFYRSTTDLSSINSQIDELIDQSSSFEGKNVDIFSDVPVKHDEILNFAGKSSQDVSLEDKKSVCEQYLDQVQSLSQIVESKVFYRDRYHVKAFKSSRGRSYIYDYTQMGMYFAWTLREGEKIFQDRLMKWTQDFNELKNQHDALKERMEDSLKHLDAEGIDPGKYTVVMSSDVVGVFAHESFGHKSEADSMMGDKDALADWDLGTQVASDMVSIVDTGVDPDNGGFVPFDDEGMPAQKNYLIKEGKLTGRLHSLATAQYFNEKPTGNGRALTFEYEPIVRMTNTYIEPGKKTFDEMISTIKDGFYLEEYKHGSGLSTFTIAPTRSYRIRDGKLAEPVRISVVSGTVFDTLKNISDVDNKYEVMSSAFGGCGKNEQVGLRVGHGGPSMVVENMQVG